MALVNLREKQKKLMPLLSTGAKLLPLFLWACLLATPLTALAVPVPPHPFTVDQPDGTAVQVTGVGDEFGMKIETIDGYTIVPGPGGWWQYAVRGADGSLTPSGIVPGKGDPASLGIARHLPQSAAELAKARERREAATRSKRLNPKIAERKRLVMETAGPIASATGGEVALQEASAALAPATFRLAVLLIEFPAYQNSSSVWEPAVPHTYSPEQINQLLLSNGTYTVSPMGNPVYGSMRDYYATASYGKFELTGQVFPWVTADYGYSYYRDTDGADALLRQEAVAKSGVDLSQFDGYAVIWAGQSVGGTRLWPHATRTDGWYMSSEKFDSGEDLSVIGVHSHEFGHVLGLSDLYYAPNNVMQWGLMGSGSYGGSAMTGYRPVQLFSSEKDDLGWAFPVMVTESSGGSFSLRAWNNYPDAVKMVSQRSVFYLENRQKTGYDADLIGSGILVLHVDHFTPNSPVNVEEADGTPGYDAGDPFPGASGNTSFGCATTPSAIDRDGTCSVEITRISITGGTATFRASLDWPSPGAGITINGAGNYPNIFTAIASANPGQSVLAPAGSFAEQVMMRPGINLQGAGKGLSILLYAGPAELHDDFMIQGAEDTTFSGFTVQGYFSQHTGFMVGSKGSGTIRIVNNSFVDHSTALNTYNSDNSGLIIANNVFYGNRHGLDTESNDGFTLFNNIFVNNEYGIYQVWTGTPSYLVDYNDFYGNSNADFYNIAPRNVGRNNLYADPLFRNAATGDYALLAGSPCINMGNPDVAWNDLDGSRNDVGVFGGPWATAPDPKVTASGVHNGLGKYVVSGSGKDKTTTWVATSTFLRGETVVVRVKVLEAGTGLPIAGATVLMGVWGKESHLITSGPTAADGTVEVSWTTTTPSKTSYGTIPGSYNATIKEVTGTNLIWDGIETSVPFTIQ